MHGHHMSLFLLALDVGTYYVGMHPIRHSQLSSSIIVDIVDTVYIRVYIREERIH